MPGDPAVERLLPRVATDRVTAAGSVVEPAGVADPLPEALPLAVRRRVRAARSSGRSAAVVPQLAGCRCRLARDHPRRRVGTVCVGAQHRPKGRGETGERGVEPGGARPARVRRVHRRPRMPPSVRRARGAARPGRACCGRRRRPRVYSPCRNSGSRPAGPGCTCRPRSRTRPGPHRPTAREAAARSSAPARARAGPSSARGPAPTRARLRQGAGVVHERPQRQLGREEARRTPAPSRGRTRRRSTPGRPRPDPRRPRPRRRRARHGRRRARRGARWRPGRRGRGPCAGPVRRRPRSRRRGARPAPRAAGRRARSGGDGARRTRRRLKPGATVRSRRCRGPGTPLCEGAAHIRARIAAVAPRR